MEDIAEAPTSSAMTGIIEAPTNGIEPIAPEPAVIPPEETENACETLYIQNLNEKIKTDGLFDGLSSRFSPLILHLLPSVKSLVTRSVQVVWRSPRCGCTR
jgi:hypothetical protein